MDQLFDTDLGFISSYSDVEPPRKKKKTKDTPVEEHGKQQNIVLKLQTRQRTGYFSNDLRRKARQSPYSTIPAHLSFCLKEIIPCCYLEGHIFMGLTACGQFLISYRGVMNPFRLRTYDFTALHRYELYFWIFRPHHPLHKFFSVCLFDDHGVDGLKTVTMTQWNSESAVLVVHGEGDSSDNDSYVTYVKVPRLGCLECKELRNEYYDGSSPREAMLCVKCCMTVHCKYRIGESTPSFDPELNLNCPNFVILNENTFIHAISIDVDSPKKEIQPCNRFTPIVGSGQKIEDFRIEDVVVPLIEPRKSIAEEIIADFEEYETEIARVTPEPRQSPRKRTIFQKMGTPPSSSKTNDPRKAKENLYEFSEDNEKCEKISTFRKRCLADKKYEFSEETLDNILPFSRIRENRINQSSISQAQDMHMHRSPNQGFRSPCGSPVGYRFLRSPPGFHSPNYYHQQRSPTMCSSNKYAMVSPRQIRKVYASPGDILRRMSSPTHRPFFDIGNENNENRNSVNFEQKNECPEEPWKVSCTKQVTRVFVEEDDANSVVTTEEDDCISPGYHTSLPLEVHGACYSNMQQISQASYSQLKHCAGVLITQKTLDTEALTVHVATHMCAQNHKVYDMLSDSTYSIAHVCPITFTVICCMRIEFFATDSTDVLKVNRRKYTISPLFTWNIQTCTLDIISYGRLQPMKVVNQTPPASLDKWIRKIRQNQINISTHLRIHTADITKTKARLIDMSNMIEFYLGHSSDFSSDESSDEFSDSEDTGLQTSSS